MAHTHYLQLQSRGVLNLPADLRRRHGLDTPGAHVELVEREDGVIELRPRVSVPADQAWFWTKRWQRMEREVDEEIERGELITYDSAEEFVRYLDSIVDNE